MLHYSTINLVSERKSNGAPVPFCFKFIARSTGEVITVNEAVVTSSNFARRTRNVMFLPSHEIRTVRNCCFIEFNGIEIYI
jgi:hypothetical protein